DRQVAHRGDHGHAAGLRDVVHARLAGEDSRAVHPHAARAADHHAAALPIGERAVHLVLDDVEAVEERRLVRRVELVFLERAIAAGRVVAPDLQGNLHRLYPSNPWMVLFVASTVSDSAGTVTLTSLPKSEKSLVSAICCFDAVAKENLTRWTYPSSLPTHTS